MPKTPKLVALNGNVKTTDDQINELKSEIGDKLSDIAALMDRAADLGVEVTFNVAKNERGKFAINSFVLTRRY